MQATLVQNRTAPDRTQASPARLIHVAFWCIAILLGALQAFANRHTMNSDGISYLDMGDALFHGDWKAILNTVWSPLYPAILGLTQFVLRPSRYLEFSVAHLTNFAIYIAALWSFTTFIRNLTKYVQSLRDGLPEWSVLCIGYSLFVWSSLCLIDLVKLSPDMTLLVFLYAGASQIVRIRLGHDGWRSYVALGVSLGLGFLAKAPMLPLATVWLAVSVLAAQSWRRGLRGAALSGMLVLLLAGPYVWALTRHIGYLTFGASGRLNYAWHVNHVPRYHWRGDVPGSGTAQHPTRRLLADPPLYEFGGPIGGTYPVWFDPGYWNEGLQPRFRFADQISALYSCTSEYLNLFVGAQGGLMVGIIVLLFMGRSPGSTFRGMTREWFLLAVPAAGLIMYQLVHFESRYIAGFLTLLWTGLLASVRVDHPSRYTQVIKTVTISVTVLLMVRTATTELGPTIQKLAGALKGQGSRSHVHWQVAEGLAKMGVHSGDRFAIIRTSADAYYWARVAGVRIVAEIPGQYAAHFWNSYEEVSGKTMAAIASTGVRGVVTPDAPRQTPPGWKPIGSTGYWVYFLQN